MKYTFTTENGSQKTVNIADEVFVQGRKEGLSNREIIDRYLSDEGYIVDPVVTKLTEKAKASGAGVKARAGACKAPTRKPDMVKRALIVALNDFLCDYEGADDVTVTNIERIIAFRIGDNNYELTLSKKRKPKA